MATGDSWASQIARPMWLDKDRGASAWIPLFFSSYIFVVGLVLMNVVVAILLDAFVTSVERERLLLHDQHEMLAKTTKAQRTEGALDALTSTLSYFSSPLDLEQKLRKLFHRMDLDENYALSFENFSKGLRHLNFTPALRISRDDFNIVTQGFLNADGELSYEGFASMMKLEIKALTSRKALASLHSNQGTITGDMLFLLKMIWSAVEEGAENKLKQHASTSCGCMARSQGHMIRKLCTRCRDFAFHSWKQLLQHPHTETHKETSNARKLGTGSGERREQQVPSAGIAHGRICQFSSHYREMGGSVGYTVLGCFRRWATEGKLPRPRQFLRTGPVHVMSALPAGCDKVRTP